ncbi:MAG TPA: hypothetical protein VJS44_00285 [Pyrinomonadaceae bacterium]|nr:hypothetical protein [Pyrinomonadaceae bacterium]
MAIKEIAPDLYRISNYIPEADLQFNQFLLMDDEPLLFHTGMRSIFPLVRDDIARVLDPSRIRWISFSHFEADECGSLNEWLQLAPDAQAACSVVGAMVSVNDFALRPALAMADGDVLKTGRHSFRFVQTPHVPHCWDAGLLFEETNGTLLSSDLFHQSGDVEPLTQSDVIERARKTLVDYQAGPLANYMPYTKHTDGIMQKLAGLKPRTIAPMHGSAYVGDGERAVRELAIVMREVLG